MNEHQRKMARKGGKSCGYVNGGKVGEGTSVEEAQQEAKESLQRTQDAATYKMPTLGESFTKNHPAVEKVKEWTAPKKGSGVNIGKSREASIQAVDK